MICSSRSARGAPPETRANRRSSRSTGLQNCESRCRVGSERNLSADSAIRASIQAHRVACCDGHRESPEASSPAQRGAIMNLRTSIFTALSLAVATTALPVFAQQSTTTETTTTTTVKKGHHRYVYYGDHDIYFAPETKVYYWREGDDWRSGIELPETFRGYISTGGIDIDLDTDKPYERNEWVIKHYKHHDRD
jgi:hypothetical protein